MTTRRAVTIVGTAVLLLSMTGAVLIVRELDQLRAGATAREVLYIPSPQIVKRLSLGYSGLLADIYWTRVVQYFGGKHKEHSMEYELLPPLLDITTTLDPKLIPAYEFGATFLAQKPPEGAGNPDASVRLLEKGIRANPENWRLYYNLGYVEYIELKNYSAAAEAFDRGSKIPGAHPWLRIMAAIMAQHGGEIGTARYLWENIYTSTDDNSIKENAVKHLAALKVDENVEKLQALVDEYHKRTGRWPVNSMELVAAGLLRRIPVDPTGRPYRITYGHVEVADSDAIPFITQGIPLAKQAPQVLLS